MEARNDQGLAKVDRERAKQALAAAYEASWTQVQVLAQAYPGRKPIYLEPQDFAEGAVDAVLGAVFKGSDQPPAEDGGTAWRRDGTNERG